MKANHIKANKKTKLIEKYHTADAHVYDSNVIEPLIDEEKDKGKDLFLDAGYELKDDIVTKKSMNPVICEKGHLNNLLNDNQKQYNRIKSKNRCRIEYVFRFIEGAINGPLVRSIGMMLTKVSMLWKISSITYSNMYKSTIICHSSSPTRDNYAQTFQIVKNSMSLSS